MTPNNTSAADSMLARTGRRMDVSESFMCESLPENVKRPNDPERNGPFDALVPPRHHRYVEKETGKSTSSVSVVSRKMGPERIPKYGRSQGTCPKSHTSRFNPLSGRARVGMVAM